MRWLDFSLRGLLRLLVVMFTAMQGTAAFAYDAKIHQHITFLAAKQINRCLGPGHVPPLTPLQVRSVAQGNSALADSNFMVRMLRWGYYDPLEREDMSVAWLVNTRLNDHFGRLAAGIEDAETDAERLALLGAIVSYIQLVSSPARALPVYVSRFWRWNFADRFDEYPLLDTELEAALQDDCSHLDSIPESFDAILAAVAADTRAAVRGPIGALPATWEAFWVPPDVLGGFGSYGPAGNNFGRYTEFPCGLPDIHRCVLITDDPAYTAFALERQMAAIRGTAQAIMLFQARYAPPLPSFHQLGVPPSPRPADADDS